MERTVYVKNHLPCQLKKQKKVFDLAKEKRCRCHGKSKQTIDADMRTVRKVIETGVLGELLEIRITL